MDDGASDHFEETDGPADWASTRRALGLCHQWRLTTNPALR
jgi:hypothetical protein